MSQIIDSQIGNTGSGGESHYLQPPYLETAGAAARCATASAGAAGAGYGSGFPGFTFGEAGKGRYSAFRWLVAVRTGSFLIGLTERAQQFKLEATIRAGILINRHFLSPDNILFFHRWKGQAQSQSFFVLTSWNIVLGRGVGSRAAIDLAHADCYNSPHQLMQGGA